ncbi:TfuA-like protein [Micromonospora craniellae]|uniref:TfuA-like core domain-containing protein n=1 Tax=Micromonospora craniellae TaxID=2294034 RepID=A0A372FZG7_9ACTN|nr:TfuA-like protein [Micromonospora craniellae]QOC93442.1 hypothetical protein ID554_07175 [Micromonospora craniellae]RFS45889.1 hypothetical protein D0Q02_14900 [Micromonospora craniellae]
MKAVVFAGPTIGPDDVATRGIRWRPPAAQGDVYRAALGRPAVIGIVDGYFSAVPAVWHKEILWAMSRGIHVLGAASMGALRAAELHPFGMVGVGAVFDGYRDGSYQADDEVAVAHGDADSGYRVMSDALVNIRATLDRAVHDEVLTPSVAGRLLDLARGLFYPERRYPRVLDLARQDPELRAFADQVTMFSRWLPSGRIDQKQADARALLQRVQQLVDTGVEAAPISFRLAQTQVWRQAQALSAAADTGGGPNTDLTLLRDELRLDGEYPEAYRQALLRHLMLREAHQRDLRPGRDTLAHAADRMRRRHQIDGKAAMDRWLADNDLSACDGERLIREQATLPLVDVVHQQEALVLLPDVLRLDGRYRTLASRAHAKADWLAQRGGRPPELADCGLAEDELWTWYFRHQRHSPVPEDLASYARAAGFSDLDEFRRAVLLDHAYHQEPR